MGFAVGETKSLLVWFLKTFPEAAPKPMLYKEWQSAGGVLGVLRKDYQIEGAHLWHVREFGAAPTVGGVENLGVVIPMSREMHRGTAPYSILQQQHLELARIMRVNSFADAKAAFPTMNGAKGEELFNLQRAVMAEVWEVTTGLEFPRMTYLKGNLELHEGRGIIQSLLPP